MAGITALSDRNGRKSLDHQIPLVPFIDFLLCLVSFLLITAVWSQTARVAVDARLPGAPPSCCVEEEEKMLHVIVGAAQAQLVWRKGTTVLDSVSVQLKAEGASARELRYPALAEAVAQQWQSNAARHFAVGDTRVDLAVLHASNALPFAELVALMDAINATKRDWRSPEGKLTQRPAFALSLSTD
jgi:biopolymer transport protein ExbD